MAELDLDSMRARADAASPGPWTIENGSIFHAGPSESRTNERWGTFVVASIGAHDIGRPGPVNTAFIAHARTDMPALLDLVEKLTGQRDHLRGRLIVQRSKILSVESERDEARAIVEDLLALLRRVRTEGVVPRPLWDEITNWLGSP